jgi:hypothetical protein
MKSLEIIFSRWIPSTFLKNRGKKNAEWGFEVDKSSA